METGDSDNMLVPDSLANQVQENTHSTSMAWAGDIQCHDAFREFRYHTLTNTNKILTNCPERL